MMRLFETEIDDREIMAERQVSPGDLKVGDQFLYPLHNLLGLSRSLVTVLEPPKSGQTKGGKDVVWVHLLRNGSRNTLYAIPLDKKITLESMSFTQTESSLMGPFETRVEDLVETSIRCRLKSGNRVTGKSESGKTVSGA